LPANNVAQSSTSTKPRSIRSLARSLAADAADLREQLQMRISAGDRQLQAAAQSLAADLGREGSVAEAADILAQSVVCAGPVVATQPREWELARGWFLGQAAGWERYVLEVLSTEYSVLSTGYEEQPARLRGVSLSPSLPLSLSPPAAHLYEHFLHAHQRSTRKRRGVFFTPRPIADFIVAAIDQSLRADFDLAGGLATMAAPRDREADASRSPWILDPACGTGVFLLSVIGHLHRRLGSDWNAFVPDLLPRLIGVEILPTAAFLAKLNIALKLAETGYDFREPGKINIHIGDALDPALQSKIQNPKSKIPVILGNPPFSSLSTNSNDWIALLVRGDDEVRGYVRANGQVLGERKTWLHDDYVRFIRLAQWHVEEAGQGIVGFITNRGYLDNATFRLMRQELLRVFPHIQIVDLHGSRKNGRLAPDGGADENVFGLDQGVAISILTRSVSEGVTPRVVYAELWGSQQDKLAALETPSLTLRVSVWSEAPDWKLVPSRSPSHPEYDAGWLLTELMPVSSPAPVTARDHFVVAFTEEELHCRIAEFRDLAIPDDEIRRRYFTRTRSARYPQGDTRGWKLATARRTVAADPDWPRHIVRCLYRPFDWRYVFWHPAMIDWPRSEVTRHLLARLPEGETGRRRDGETENHSGSLRLSFSPSLRLALIARRQQLPAQPCTFFWVSDGLALDGVIRSDNRGSESLFPLYLVDEVNGQLDYRANFNPQLVAQLAGMLGLAWLSLGRGDLARTFGPEDLLGYLYAQFHSPRYRDRYAEELRTDFPRVLPPESLEQFAHWSSLGRELIDLHLLRAVGNALCGVPRVASAAERHGGRSLQDVGELMHEIEQFRVGGYVALKKWLQPPHRSAAEAHYRQITSAISRTLEIMREIDAPAE
jgi:hypothetical protein